MSRRTYFIGRGRANDVRLPNATASRRHAELVVTDDGRYYLTDCGSTAGTEVRTGAGWKPVRQAFVALDDELRFGDCRIGVRELVARLPRTPGRPSKFTAWFKSGQRGGKAADAGSNVGRPIAKDDLPAGPVRRNPKTGQIERLSGSS